MKETQNSCLVIFYQNIVAKFLKNWLQKNFFLQFIRVSDFYFRKQIFFLSKIMILWLEKMVEVYFLQLDFSVKI